MNELRAFLAMLVRAGIGHGQRIDRNPPGASVQVEHGDSSDEEWIVTDWQFDQDGKLIGISAYKGEEG